MEGQVPTWHLPQSQGVTNTGKTHQCLERLDLGMAAHEHNI